MTLPPYTSSRESKERQLGSGTNPAREPEQYAWPPRLITVAYAILKKSNYFLQFQEGKCMMKVALIGAGSALFAQRMITDQKAGTEVPAFLCGVSQKRLKVRPM
jgi:hypothetical protein